MVLQPLMSALLTLMNFIRAKGSSENHHACRCKSLTHGTLALYEAFGIYKGQSRLFMEEEAEAQEST